jgi:hypothetical protein
LEAERDPKLGLGLRAIRTDTSTDGTLAPIDVVPLVVRDRAWLPGDEAIALGMTGSREPYVVPVGGLPLALPLAADAAGLINETSRAALVIGLRDGPQLLAREGLLSTALVIAEGRRPAVALNGTSSGALIDLEVQGRTATIVRNAAPTTRDVRTHRLDRVIVGGVGILDRHGDAAHLSCNAPFIAPDAPAFDGVLAFERGFDEGAREGTIPHRVHRRLERTTGTWVDHVLVPVYQDDDTPPPDEPREPGDPETPPPVPPEGPPGGGGGVPGIPLPPTIPEPPGEPVAPPDDAFPAGKGGLVIPLPWDANRTTAGSPHEWHAPGFAFRASPMTSAGVVDYRSPNGALSAAHVAEARARPVTLHVEGYGYEAAGGRWVLNRHDARRRYRYAESSQGGAVVLPPELGLEHHRDSWAPAGITPSTSYLTFLSTYSRLGLGKPDPATGGLKSGFAIYEKGSNNLYIDNHDANGVATLIATWESNGDLDLRSGDLTATDANIVGALNHDGSTVGFFGSTPVAQPEGAWTPADGLIEDAELRGVVAALVVALKDLGLITDA